MFERIVVAVDGSEPAKHALSVACDLAQKYGSQLHLVHSPQLETTGLAVGYASVMIDPSADEVTKAGRRVLAEAEHLTQGHGCSAASSTVGMKDPAADILAVVQETEADLVVMGRRGLGSVGGLIMGSVSQKVSHGADCSCMTVS